MRKSQPREWLICTLSFPNLNPARPPRASLAPPGWNSRLESSAVISLAPYGVNNSFPAPKIRRKSIFYNSLGVFCQDFTLHIRLIFACESTSVSCKGILTPQNPTDCVCWTALPKRGSHSHSGTGSYEPFLVPKFETAFIPSCFCFHAPNRCRGTPQSVGLRLPLSPATINIWNLPFSPLPAAPKTLLSTF